MAKVYKDINICVGFNYFQTYISRTMKEVNTENNATRLVVSYPAEMADYSKIVDILYFDENEEPVVKSYGLTYNSDLDKYTFEIPRLCTMGECVYVQFRARYITGDQEFVDTLILRLNYSNAIKMENFDILSDIPDEYTTILQSMIDVVSADLTEHESVKATSSIYGHIITDEETIASDIDGKISTIGGTFRFGLNENRPTTAPNGTLYYSTNTGSEILEYYNGSTWLPVL